LSTASLPQKLQDALKTEAVTMTFGPDGFFGYSLCNADGSQVQWWSTFEAASPLPRDLPVSEIRESLLRRHGEWKSPHDTSEHPVFSSIIKQACGSSDSATAVEQGVLVLPVYVISRLSTWGSESGRILLLGDAAHTMPPDTGQGVSCAAEDAIAIAMLLQNAGENVDFRKLKEDYEALRMPRIHKILDIAKRMGDQKKKLSTVQELMRDVAMWVMCKLPEGTVSERFAYDVQMEVEKLLEKRKVQPS
jgi:2-polyprenyl-6-methoxyphenol hydroxylase-like FAD-dependent oxidoreductase